MKRVSEIGWLFLILSIPATVWFWSLYDPVPDPKAVAFLKEKLPLILNDWNEKELLKIVDKEYQLTPGDAVATAEDVHRIFLGNKQRYGKMTKFILNQDSTIGGCSTDNYNTPNNIGCVVGVAFEKKNASIVVELNKYQDDYKIRFFEIEPE